MTPRLLQPLALRSLSLRNRIVIAPMCMYSATDGVANDFHLVHLGRFALGGAGLVIVEATAVQPEGRITHGDLGLWNDEQAAPLARIAAVLKQLGAAAGIQLAHAGRKASMQRPWQGNGPMDASDTARGEQPWGVIAPTAMAVEPGWLMPREMAADDIAALKRDFRLAAGRALRAGFEVLELHCAHGYLLHSFLSPITNQRSDAYGGDRAGRMRLPLEIAASLRELWPQDKPVFVRVSSVDAVENGWSIADSIAFARELKRIGIDVVDCSSGGVTTSPTASAVPREYGFQLPYSQAIREGAGVATMAVGLIVDAQQAERVLQDGQADLVAIARQALEDPNWPAKAQTALLADRPALERFGHWLNPYGWWLARRAKLIDKLGPWQG
ncbi:MAG TPA: NADH:flavin oxidoreductase/NADH oxidase [Rhizobacter sp.]|nr:NADH:flavin oxidoreductase/NADH oxidase [Rhizobacter sp.]